MRTRRVNRAHNALRGMQHTKSEGTLNGDGKRTQQAALMQGSASVRTHTIKHRRLGSLLRLSCCTVAYKLKQFMCKGVDATEHIDMEGDQDVPLLASACKIFLVLTCNRAVAHEFGVTHLRMSVSGVMEVCTRVGEGVVDEYRHAVDGGGVEVR